MKTKRHFDISMATLHILAMALMLCDHLWATVVPGNQWLTCLGRLAYPIFAFMIVEGYFHTRNLRRYILRLFLFALISEIPFNLMYSASLFYPYHQNVIWTLLMGLGLIHLNELAKGKGKLWLRVLTAICTTLVGSIAGLLCMVDYHGVGVATILVFYFLRGRKWWCLLGQFAALYYLNVGNTVNVFHIRKQSPHKLCGLKNLNMVQYLDYIGHLYMSEPAAPIELRALTYLCNYRLKNAALPGYCAWLPSSSSMRRS